MYVYIYTYTYKYIYVYTYAYIYIYQILYINRQDAFKYVITHLNLYAYI
jgi:hypothetical protein